MWFLLRASLAIGLLSYLAVTREAPGTLGQGHAADALASALTALPADLRDRALRDGLGEVARRWPGPALPSSDTLAEADRRPAWRGVEAR
ncbi:hypothetical protein ACFPQ7_04485 [Methylobacterium iners]|uniref:hypothetical protein n=1 Tax=Methylobacterium iners TaxID=418707 RepID=UPI00361B2A15